MTRSLEILLRYQLPDEQRKRLVKIAPATRVHEWPEYEKNPELAERIEVFYGHLTPEFIGMAPNLRWVQVTSAGVENEVTDEFRQRGLLLTNGRGIHAESMTEHVFAMLLTLVRALPLAMKQQMESLWDQGAVAVQTSNVLVGRTLGILGLGAIGARVASVGRALGLRIIGLRFSGQPHPEAEIVYSPETRLDFFHRADVVVNILPMTKATSGFVGKAEFDAMPQGGIFVNVGRGGTVNTDALVDALRSGRLGGACLDVVDPEPLPREHPLWKMPNVIIVPHTGGVNPDYARRAGEIFLDNVVLYLEGKPLRNLIDLERGC